MILRQTGAGVSTCFSFHAIAALALLGAIPLVSAGGAFPLLEIDGVFASNLVRAVVAHPSVRTARFREASAAAQADALDVAFRSPALAVGAGYAQGAGDVPGISIGRVAPSDAVTFEGGVEAPVGGGVYVGAGAAERVLAESEQGGDLVQTALGARLRIPLLRDAAYGLHRHEFSKRHALALRRRGERLQAQHAVARGGLLAWLDHIQGLADLQAVENAAQRAERLCEQTTERSLMQDVAAYQVFPTRYEVAIRREEVLEARQIVQNRLETLRERLGLHAMPSAAAAVPAAVSGETNDLVAVAQSIVGRGAILVNADDVLRRHPSCLIAAAAVEAAAAARRLVEEQAKDSLDLTAGAGWRGESESGVFGNESLTTSENALFEIGLAWRRPLDRRGIQLDVAAATAELEAALADAAAVENAVLGALVRAQADFAGAVGRLSLAAEAIEEARKTLAAEEQRFNLGEGTSRNVLDAQKDLTAAVRRCIVVARSVMSALVELCHAAGVNPVELVAPGAADLPTGADVLSRP
ncbi:MAG: TolC family protein [Kiritimatiellia bacterium]|jgi:outer membrane protein TolC